jgi:hypothetical protein
MKRKYTLCSSRDSRGRYCLHLRVEKQYWHIRFELKADAIQFAVDNTAKVNALIDVIETHGLALNIQEALCNIFNQIAPFEIEVGKARRFFLIFAKRSPYKDAQQVMKLTPHQCIEMDHRIRELPEISDTHFVVCFERDHNSLNSSAIPLTWELNAEAVYERHPDTGEYLPIKQRAGVSYTEALREIESEIVPFAGRIGLVIPALEKNMDIKPPTQEQLESLQNEPLYEQFSKAGFNFYQFPNTPKPIENELGGMMQKWMYEGEERAYKINLHFFDLYSIENYPRDGSVPRWLYEVRLNLNNVYAGQAQLAGVLFRFRVSSVLEAESAAAHFWRASGSPEA